MKFKNLKPGDSVFVVWQSRRYCNDPPKMYDATISKVGRKYGIFDESGFGVCHKFDLATGYSVHGESHNARANGFGFDVYSSREEYERICRERTDFGRLAKRLCGQSHSHALRQLPPDAVEKIHAILDEVESQSTVSNQQSQGRKS